MDELKLVKFCVCVISIWVEPLTVPLGTAPAEIEFNLVSTDCEKSVPTISVSKVDCFTTPSVVNTSPTPLVKWDEVTFNLNSLVDDISPPPSKPSPALILIVVWSICSSAT